MLYLTDSEAKRRVDIANETDKRSKKKLYTEKVPSTPEVPKTKLRINVNSTTKKNKINKALSVTEMVEIMKDDVDVLAKKVGNICVTPIVESVQRINFIGSLTGKIYKHIFFFSMVIACLFVLVCFWKM